MAGSRKGVRNAMNYSPKGSEGRDPPFVGRIFLGLMKFMYDTLFSAKNPGSSKGGFCFESVEMKSGLLSCGR